MNKTIKERLITALTDANLQNQLCRSCLNGTGELYKTPFYDLERLLDASIKLCELESSGARLIMRKSLMPGLSSVVRTYGNILSQPLKLADKFDKFKLNQRKLKETHSALRKLLKIYDPFSSQPVVKPVEHPQETVKETPLTVPSKPYVTFQERMEAIHRKREVEKEIREMSELNENPNCYFVEISDGSKDPGVFLYP